MFYTQIPFQWCKNQSCCVRCCLSIKSYDRKQRSVALSLLEAEYMVASQESCEAIWMRKVIPSLFGRQMDPKVIHYDNQSCMKLSVNLDFHDKSKHIDIWYHHLRDYVQRHIISLEYILREENDVEVLMKVMTRINFELHRKRIRVVDNPFFFGREH